METKYPSEYLQKAAFSPIEVSSIAITSGITGLPKFVEWATTPLILGAKTCIERYKMTSDDIVIALGPIGWGSTVFVGFVAAPIVAAKIVLLEKFTPEEGLNLVEKEKCTIAAGAAAQLIMMVRDSNFHKYDVSSLRAFSWTGAPLPYHMAIEAEEAMGCTIVGMYGGQDMGVPHTVSIDDPSEVRHLTVGKPLPGTETKLVDDAGEEVPQGEVGEILSRGAACFPGRYKSPEDTLKVWGAMGKEGWYRTNDLGKFDKAGNLSVVGRKEDIIVRSGQKVYPLEIENILLTHPKVSNVAVVGMPDTKEGERVCAYVIPKPQQQFTYDDMISFLEKKGLSPYKLPQRLEIIDRFPMSSGGQKILKRELVNIITLKLKAEGKI
jgi:acyl-CoA synthetase (AMP-forming)/AMP-acid ligase II